MKYDLSEITEVIRNRRTVFPEQFSERVVHRDMIAHMLTNATWAPTHAKTQPWRFTVYTGDGRNALIECIRTLFVREFGAPDDARLARMVARVERTSALILLAMARSADPPLPEIEEIEAVACAAQNLLLTATAYGLGAFWSSPKIIYRADAPDEFGYGKEDKILGLLYLGYPAQEWPKGHRKPLEYVTTWIEG